MNQRSVFSSLRILTQVVKLQSLLKSLQLQRLRNTQVLVPCPAKQRYFSITKGPLRVISYEELKNISNKTTVIIDVREPKELATDGTIPGTINIPLGELQQALKTLSDEEFFKKYGRNKPHKNHTLIFSCKTGGRSKKAQLLAVKLGYKNAINYSGGWNDWAKKSKSRLK